MTTANEGMNVSQLEWYLPVVFFKGILHSFSGLFSIYWESSVCRPEMDIRMREWMTGLLSSARRKKTNSLTEHTSEGVWKSWCPGNHSLAMALSVSSVVGMRDSHGGVGKESVRKWGREREFRRCYTAGFEDRGRSRKPRNAGSH